MRSVMEPEHIKKQASKTIKKLLSDGDLEEVSEKFAAMIVASWEADGHAVANGEDRGEIIKSLAKNLCSIADCECASLVTLSRNEKDPGKSHLKSSLFGPLTIDRIVDMLNAYRSVSAKLAGQAANVNPVAMATFLGQLKGPGRMLAAVTSMKKPGEIPVESEEGEETTVVPAGLFDSKEEVDN
jgi:hypothetical protein